MPSSKSWIARHREGGIYSFVILLVAALVCGGVVAGALTCSNVASGNSSARWAPPFASSRRASAAAKASRPAKFAPAIEGLNSVYRTDGGAWVFDVSATGYHGDVELMVGIAADGTVAGIQFVAEDDTDGIGTNALTEEYFGTFAGMPAGGALTLEDAGSDQTHVDGVSGATFTSNAVVGCLNIAFEAYAQLGGN